MAFGHDAALDLSLRDVARDNVRVPAVLGERLRPALSPTRSRRRLWGSLQRPQSRSGDGERRAQVRRCMREMAPTRATGAHQDHCRSRKHPRQVVANVPAGPLPYFGGPCSEMLRSVAIRNCGSACPAVHGTSIPSVLARTYPFPRLTRQHWHANWYARAAWITCARGTPHHTNRRRRRSLGRFRERATDLGQVIRRCQARWMRSPG